MASLKIALVTLLFVGSTLFAGAQSLIDTTGAAAIGGEIGKGSSLSGLNAAKRAREVARQANALQEQELLGDPARQRQPGSSGMGLRSFLDSLAPGRAPRTVLQESDLSTTPAVDIEGAVQLLRTTNIFKSRDVILKWLGGNPKFVYDTKDYDDPMLIPWLAAEYGARVLRAEAMALWEEGGKDNWAKALFYYEKILINFNETEVAQKVYDSYQRDKIAFDDKYNQAQYVEKNGEVLVERVLFPEDIKKGFTSILAGNLGRKVMISDDIYQEGDQVRGGGLHPVVIRKIVTGQSSIRGAYIIFDFNGKEYWFMQHGDSVPGHENPEF